MSRYYKPPNMIMIIYVILAVNLLICAELNGMFKFVLKLRFLFKANMYSG